jgi:glycosyltransferase involved in cell wall biosynthesis
MPRVSVIIPTFNRETLVAEAVRSVLDQTYCDFELIVVDDGSTDGTAQALAPPRSMAGDRLRYIAQEHRGPSAARNAALRIATGELIAFLDSDDLWRPRKLERQVAFLDAHPALALCHTDEIWIRSGRRVNPRERHRKSGGYIFPRALELCIISPSAAMLRRSLIQDVAFPGGALFDESLPACEDYDLWLRITWKYEVGFLPEPLTVKRGGRPDQLSSAVEALDRFRIRAIENLLRRNVLSPEQTALAIAELKRKCDIYAAGCRKRGKIAEAEYYSGLWQSLSSSAGQQDISQEDKPGK